MHLLEDGSCNSGHSTLLTPGYAQGLVPLLILSHSRIWIILGWKPVLLVIRQHTDVNRQDWAKGSVIQQSLLEVTCLSHQRNVLSLTWFVGHSLG